MKGLWTHFILVCLETKRKTEKVNLFWSLERTAKPLHAKTHTRTYIACIINRFVLCSFRSCGSLRMVRFFFPSFRLYMFVWDFERAVIECEVFKSYSIAAAHTQSIPIQTHEIDSQLSEWRTTRKVKQQHIYTQQQQQHQPQKQQ